MVAKRETLHTPNRWEDKARVYSNHFDEYLTGLEVGRYGVLALILCSYLVPGFSWKAFPCRC